MEDRTPHHFETLADFVRWVEGTVVDQSLYLFRGQAADWPLLPGIARETLTRAGLLDVEQKMLEEFQRHSLPLLRVAPPTVWDWVALAQHHGLPTRLLDWTLSPFTVTKVVIPGGRFAHFRFHLSTHGVNPYSMLPGLDGLCAYIKWQNCYLPDEHSSWRGAGSGPA